MPELINLTLSATVEGEDEARGAARVLTEALGHLLDTVPGVQSASVSIFRDDFLQAEAEAKSEEAGEIHVHLPDTPEEAARVNKVVREALNRAGYGHVPDDGKLS
jgi:hypothetical protein